VIFVVGPTAAGKSAFAVNLALKTGGEIVSADSMQVYKGFDLGTAKPSAEEMRGVAHHMIDIADPGCDYSVGAYAQAAQAVIADIGARGRQAIVCGGSGLYVHSLLYEMDFSGRAGGGAMREALLKEAEERGGEYMFEKLLEADPDAAARVHPHNVKRVIRAIERVHGDIERVGLRGFSDTFAAKVRYDARIMRLTADREALYRRIERRAEDFFANGLVDEVRRILESGVPADGTAMRGIGYKEVAAMLAGAYDEDEALRLVKQNTRRYAKRQETWFRGMERKGVPIHWLPPMKTAAEQAAFILNAFRA
jgi:tRNA dimethylallyltransferase